MKTIQLNITIKNINPPIWRRVVAPAETSLLELHDVIQFTFGWGDTHLFIFEIESMEFVHYPDWKEVAYRYQAAEKALLKDLIPSIIPEGGKFNYIYDMGDCWEHVILVEKVMDVEHYKDFLECISGSGACPPENVGGTDDYEKLLDSLQNPQPGDDEYFLFYLPQAFDPDKFDIDFVNKGLRNYLKNCRLSRSSSWETRIHAFNPSTDFKSKWTETLATEERKIVEALPFRRDMVTLLDYLQNNKVKGTHALGNFPRKHIRDMTARFVNPPVLDQKFGNRIFALQSENEIPELIFLHVLANVSGLILGGEDMVWTVSFLGKLFLKHKPEEQLWFLTKYWFNNFNWLYCFRYNVLEEGYDTYALGHMVLELLLSYPLDKPISIETLIGHLDELDPEWVRFEDIIDVDYFKRYFILEVILVPLERLGLIECIRKESYYKKLMDIVQITMTAFGQGLLAHYH